MNLIEQLGGYAWAKEIALDPLHPQMTHVSNDGRHWVNEKFSYIPEIQEQIPTMIRIKDIRKALLEYRRQHNIFEVGDKVVKTNPKLKFEFIREVKGVFKGDSVWLDYVGYKWKYPKVRHVTDAEIKAGRRLENTL